MRMKRWCVLILCSFIFLSDSPHVQAAHTQGCPNAILETFGDRAHDACIVAWCESRWDAGARNPRSGARGLFQIMPFWGWGSSFDPWVNAAFAFELSHGGYDWSQWDC